MSVSINARLPRFIAQNPGSAQTVSLPLYGPEGEHVSATAAVYSLLDSAGTFVVEGEVGTTPGGVPTYSIASSLGSTYALPQDPWRERWEVTLTTGETLQLEREVILCRRGAVPLQHITVDALYQHHPELRRFLPQSHPTGQAGTPVDLAWEELLTRMLGDGVLPNHVLNWWSVGVIHKYWALSLACAAQTDNSELTRKSDPYMKRADSEYTTRLRLALDSNGDGVADNPGKLSSPEPMVVLQELPQAYPYSFRRTSWR